MAWNKDTIVRLLLEAGDIAQRLKSTMRHELKDDRSIVTEADKEVEALLTRALEDPARGTYLIGEETVVTKGESYLESAFERECFVVDPIDGTAPYSHFLPCWGVSIGRMAQGVLTDGAVYLPDMGEMLLNDGDEILEGVRRNGEWTWTVLGSPRPFSEAHGLVALTQAVAKRGRALISNPALVLGVAVVPMLGLLQGRFVAYLGSVKLWDIAGALPMLLRKGFRATVRVGNEFREVTERVESQTYYLQPGSPNRWALRSDLLICRPENEDRFRRSFTSGEP